MKKRALIAMSGGVDSSVSAVLMKEKGYECIGVTMKLYDNEDAYMEQEKTCCTLSDVEDARRFVLKLGFLIMYVTLRTASKRKSLINLWNVINAVAHPTHVLIVTVT